MFKLIDSNPRINQMFFDTAVLNSNTSAVRDSIRDGSCWVYMNASKTTTEGRQKYAIVPSTDATADTGLTVTATDATAYKTKLIFPVIFSREGDSHFHPIPETGLITFLNPFVGVEAWVTADSYYAGTDTAGVVHPAFAAGKPIRISSIVDADPTVVNGIKLTVIDATTSADADARANCQIGWALSAVINGMVKVRYQIT